MKQIISKLLNLREVRRKSAKRVLDKKKLKFEKNWLLEKEDFSEHYGDQAVSDVGLENVIEGFVIDRINFIEDIIGSDIESDSFADFGDSSGIFLKSLGKSGLSLNISKEALINIRKKGLEGVRAHVEAIPFKEGSIDHILFFEILEHLPNPIEGLTELNRVCNKSVILSIPYVKVTNINRPNYDPGRPKYQHHIFEFSDEDFRKVAAHAGFRVANARTVMMFDDGGTNLFHRLIFTLWYCFRERDLFCGCFNKFTIYQLVKSVEVEI